MNSIAQPAPMPVDKEAWRSRLHLSNFVNAAHQYEDVVSCTPGKRLLVIGPGQGLETAVFRSSGFEVVTYDIDVAMAPDVTGSAHDMSCFGNGQFDVAIASHVLEHMAFPFFEPALREMSRVARHALVYLPYGGRHLELGLVRRQHEREYHLRLNIPPFWRQPSTSEARFADGQHYWEIGVRGCSRRRIAGMLAKHFTILRAYQNPHWLVSMNYVLASRASCEP